MLELFCGWYLFTSRDEFRDDTAVFNIHVGLYGPRREIKDLAYQRKVGIRYELPKSSLFLHISHPLPVGGTMRSLDCSECHYHCCTQR